MRIIYACISIAFVIGMMGCSTPYSERQILKKTEQMLTHNSAELCDWLNTSERVCLDTLVEISSSHISVYDTVRIAIYESLAQQDVPLVLEMMKLKLVEGNVLEKLLASAYVYRHYGVDSRLGYKAPLAVDLVLLHSFAENLAANVDTVDVHVDTEICAEVACTFPETASLYRKFILDHTRPIFVRQWFVRSLAQSSERADVVQFLKRLTDELSHDSPIRITIAETLSVQGAFALAESQKN